MLRRRCYLMVLLLGVGGRSGISQAGNDPAQQLNADAKAAAQSGDTQLAEQKYLAVIKLHPQLAAAYNNLGHFYYEHGALDQAVHPLERASELDPGIEAPRALLGFVYYQKGNYKAAGKTLSVAVKLNPADRVAKLFFARSLVQQGDLKGAIVALQQLQTDDPNNPEVLYTLGTVYSGLARATLGRIQEVAPDSYLIELLLGSSAESRLQYGEAAQHYKSAVAKSPNVADLHYHYAHALAASGDADGAVAEYRSALALDPYDASSNWEAARVLVQTDPGEALRLATRALDISPQTPEAHMQRGRALLALGNARDAASEFQTASTLDQADETAHFQLAKAYRQLGLTAQEAQENAVFLRMQKERHAASEQVAPPN